MHVLSCRYSAPLYVRTYIHTHTVCLHCLITFPTYQSTHTNIPLPNPVLSHSQTCPSSLQVLPHHAAKVTVLCTFKALDKDQTDEILLKDFYRFYDVLSLRWERVSATRLLCNSLIYWAMPYVFMYVCIRTCCFV